MSKANEPAYPTHATINDGTNFGSIDFAGVSKKEKLAMEIYARRVDLTSPDDSQEVIARRALNAADIFFEQLEKNK